MKIIRSALLLKLSPLSLVFVLLLACTSQGQGTPKPTATLIAPASPFSPTTSFTSTAPPPTTSLPPSETPVLACTYTPTAETNVYTRPDLAADLFTLLPAGSSTKIIGQTDNGWIGFDPGTAQAANIGPFRLRWVQADPADLTGSCGSLTVFWAPPPGVCFDMPMDDTPVYAAPDASSEVIVTLHPEEFAEILGQSSTGWAKIDLSAGNTTTIGVGWVEAATLNMNGPCDNLPTISG